MSKAQKNQITLQIILPIRALNDKKEEESKVKKILQLNLKQAVEKKSDQLKETLHSFLTHQKSHLMRQQFEKSSRRNFPLDDISPFTLQVPQKRDIIDQKKLYLQQEMLRNNQRLSQIEINMVSGPSVLEQAFAICDEGRVDEYIRVKADWLRQKRALEKQLVKQNGHIFYFSIQF